MSAKLQEWIHFIEEGGGVRLLRAVLVCVAFLAVAIIYNVVAFKNFNTEEAMDAAQLARNISSGEGYTTDHIRLSAVALNEARANQKLATIQAQLGGGSISADRRARLEREQDQLRNLARLKVAQPDLANAPAYPMLLAGLMKIAPIEYKIPRKAFGAHVPELWIAGLNQILFFLAALILFRIARQLFDRPIAFVSALLFGATELFWRFSVSGLPVMLLLVIFLLLVWSLLRFEGTTENTSAPKLLVWPVMAGALVAAGCLTRYAFGWLIVPVLLFFLLFGKVRRIQISLAALATFVLVISPWLARNHSVSGNFFGTASYAISENTPVFPENQMDRSLTFASDLKKVGMTDYLRKFMLNSRDLVENEIPRLGGSWLFLMFLAGLLLPLQNKTQSRIRVFLLMSVLCLWPVYAFGKSHLATDSPLINSENLLLLIGPVAFSFAVSLYFNFVRKIVFPEPVFSYVATIVFCLIISAPLIFALLPPRLNPNAYPPYHPPVIQETASWLRENEMMMSDVPWAVAWYGNRQCLSLSQTYAKDFIHLNDDVRPIQALYLSSKTTEARFISQVVKDPLGWGRFVLECLTKNEPPGGFPLKKAPPGFLPDHFFLTDWERWAAASIKREQK